MLVMPIVVLFYQENGLGMKEVFVLQAIYSIAIVVLEIPSGYFADALGRKNTLVIGTTLGFLGFLTYSLSNCFWGFLIAEVILGFGQSLISGADSALLYDSLLVHKKEDDYMKHEGRMISVGNFAEASAGVVGGLLATLSLRYPYYFQTAIAFFAIPAAATLFEPNVIANKLKISFLNILEVVKYSLITNRELRVNILFSSFVGASTLTMAWFVQPWFIEINLPVSLFGILWTLLNLSVGLTALFAYRIEHFFGVKTTVLAFTLFLALGFFGTAYFQTIFGLAFIFLFYLARGIATPVLKDYINRISSSDVRATILSVRNFVIRIVFAIWGPFYGWYTDRFTLQGAIAIAGIVFILLSSASLILFFRKSKSII